VTLYGVPLAPPTVSAVSPNKGLTDVVGSVITLTGTNFDTATAVTVGGKPCASFTINSATSISCTLPVFNYSAAGVKDVVVVNPDGTSTVNAGAKYTVVAQYLELSTDGNVQIDVNPGTFSSKRSIATVSTNAPNGYVLSIQADSSNLTHTIPTNTIPTLTGFSAAAPSSASNTSSLIGNGNNSFWAYRVTNQGNFGANTTQETNASSTNFSWATIPTTNTIIRTGTTTDNLTTNIPQATDIWYGTAAAGNQGAGNYTTTITYTASSPI
jgi:hypothetical protein